MTSWWLINNQVIKVGRNGRTGDQEDDGASNALSMSEKGRATMVCDNGGQQRWATTVGDEGGRQRWATKVGKEGGQGRWARKVGKEGGQGRASNALNMSKEGW